MKTPAGNECKFFYADYFRGKEKEECRLLASASPHLAWKAQMCFTCPVPEILLANACSYLVLHPRLVRPFPFTRQQVQVRAFCTKTERGVVEPHIGCGECHPIPFTLPGEPGESNTSS